MAALDNPRREMFAQALARGCGPSQAEREAGYSRCSKATRARVASKQIKDRLAQIGKERAGGNSPDIGPVIDKLMELANASADLKTAAAMVAARGFLVEAARLKGLLPAPAPPPRRRLSNEEWLAEYAPEP